MRMTEEEYAALMRQRAPEPRRTADQAAGDMTLASAPAEAPSGPKFKSKAEARYAQLLEAQKRDGLITDWRYEAVTLRLADGVRYTPDFLTIDREWHMTLIEVKGGYIRDDARIKLRVAAAMFRGFKWFLVVAKKGGGWDVERL